jgi:hypothetical protein
MLEAAKNYKIYESKAPIESKVAITKDFSTKIPQRGGGAYTYQKKAGDVVSGELKYTETTDKSGNLIKSLIGLEVSFYSDKVFIPSEFFETVEQVIERINKINDSANSQNNNLNKSKPKEPLFYVLVTIGVLTLGYFAYNKLKK